MLKKIWIVFIVFFAATALTQDSVPTAASSSLPCIAINRLLRMYLLKHYLYRNQTPEIESRTVKNYLERLDPSKTLFLKSEVQDIEKDLKSFFTQLNKGDCSLLDTLNQRVIGRQKETENFVRTLLQNPKFVLDENVELVDSDKRDFAKSLKEREDLIRKFVNFNIFTYTSSDEKFDEAKRLTTHRYELMTKRASEVTIDDLYYQFIDAFGNALDPHTTYFSPDSFEDFNISMRLSLDGIGVLLSGRDGYTLVEEIVPGGPADKAKVLREKDKIIAVGQEGQKPVNIIDMALPDVVKMIRGKKGSKVYLTLIRQSDKMERLTVSITRGQIQLEDQAARLTFEKRKVDQKELNLAYLQLPSFYGDEEFRSSFKDVKKLLEEVRAKKADGLVLDLSRNGGGLLKDAVLISGLFLKEAGVVATRSPDERPQILEDSDSSIDFNKPLVVLISKRSASASEILAGALKDYGRALIVGDKSTFGKGSVQVVVPLPPGYGALKVTSSMFFLPGGQSTQNIGVTSDVEFPSLSNSETFGEKSLSYALPPQRIKPFKSNKANYSKDDKDRYWKPIEPWMKKVIAQKSDFRIKNNKEFQEIVKQLKDSEKNNNSIKLKEMIKKFEEGKKKGSKKEDEKDKEGRREEIQDIVKELQSQEALSILADLVLLSK